MSIYRELAYDRVISGIKGIQFCILSEQDIRRRSVVEVTENQTFMGNEPVQNGLFDLRMGVVDGSRVCATCQQRNTFCPGHFGHIVLARPVFYIQFFAIVRKLMKCVCFRCSRILVDLEGPEVRRILNRKISRQKRWEAMSKHCAKVKRCGADTVDGCGAKVPDKVIQTELMTLKLVWKDADGGGGASNGAGREIIFNAEDVLRVLRRVSDLDCEALGFSAEHNRPERMICTVMPVPPPAVRPSVRHETGQRQEDDLTHTLSDIIKRNNLIKDCIARGTSTYHTIETVHVPLLQYHVATLIDNSIPSMFQVKDRTGRAFRSLTERLKHKEGRIRGNLMGKRVDFSARTVITPDPNISIDELGVPLKIAMNLTFPEIVGPSTRAELQRLVLAGPDVYPGAKQVRKAAEGNRTIRLRGHPDPASIVLEDGDIVERHLINGDYVLFNRQPSLHKMSMMAHRVRVMPYNTFRLNVMACSSYNADFDGDEMNLHVPQSLQTQYELKELAAVPLHVLSPRYSRPIITIVQDVALGVFRITQPGVSVSQRQLYNISCSNELIGGFVASSAGRGGNGNGNGNGNGRWTGREVLSTVLPPTASVRMRTEDDDSKFVADLHDVRVVDGIIKSGVLSEKVFSKASTGLVHSTYNTLGPQAVIAMLNSTQKLICDWLVLSGFSVGVADMVIKKGTEDKKSVMIATAKRGVLELLRKVHAGTFENNSTKSDADMLEDKIGGILSQVATEAYNLTRSEFDIGNNRLLNMIESGSKGKTVNFQQMTACLGPQSIEGRRVIDGFSGRTLPHFTKYDDGPEARGFVEHSFIEGLTPHEFFFHSMAGRIGLIDTAVRSVTWETPVVVIEAGTPKRVLIGEWIDGLLEGDASKGDVKTAKYFPDEKNLELLDLDREVYIPTLDGKGNVTWGLMSAVTRHDPGEKLYRVVTEGGRTVTVAESKSLLVWSDESKEFVEKDSRLVKIGDFLPVTMKLPEPPVVTTHVDMTKYLPKKEYIYGTDFNLARRMIHEAQGTKHKIPVGWWEAHNGNDFTFPYTKKASVTRAEGRSNVDDVKEGCVYPYHATRCCGHLPDKFELNEENGIFIGLFLADGHTCEPSGVVGITKNDAVIQNWVKEWFEKQGFKTRLAKNTNDLGTSYTMLGYSQLLARFIDAFVGHGSRNKFVPDAAFTAPMPFVRGVLSGYFSGDGYIKVGGVNVDSVSSRLIEGVAMLCTRMGAFGRISVSQQKSNNRGTVDIAPMNHLAVRAQWGQILKDKLSLVHPDKKAALASTSFAASHGNYDSFNDVVMDPVKSIEVIGAEEHPKLYDVTVPSTLNFIVANGLGIVDTSETGYLQRRLVKAMEDCKIAHDLTVRNANNFIIQFLYGEDGMDAIKLEYHNMKHVLGREPAELRNDFLLTDPEADLKGHVTPEVLEKMKKEDETYRRRSTEHFKRILEDRRQIIGGLYKGLQENLPIVYPVNILRLVEQSASLHAKQIVSSSGAKLSDLDPLTILDAIEALAEQLVVGGAASAEKIDGVQWMPVLLRVFLSPKQILRKHRLNRAAFDRVITEIRRDFYGSVASPGEMIGIMGAQSIGEPLSQLSVDYQARLMTTQRGKSYDGPIGKLIDEMLQANASRVVDLGEGSVVLDLEEDVFVIGVSNDEKTSWRRIQQVSRHPANGGMVRIRTASGKTTCATLSHSFLKRTERGIAPVLGSDLKVGDRVPIARFIPSPPPEALVTTVRIGKHETVQLSRDFGWLCGAYLADGNVVGNSIQISKVIEEYQQEVTRIMMQLFQLLYSNGPDTRKEADPDLSAFMLEQFNTGSHVKRIPAWVYSACPEFVSGLLCGYIDGDGSISSDGNRNGIRTASVSEKLTEDFVLLFARVGIFGSKCRETHIKEANRSDLHDLHTIQIPAKYAKAFQERVGPLVVKTKSDLLERVIQCMDRESKNDSKEFIDHIPELGNVIASIGKLLELDGQSRLYGRWTKKEAIGRETLRSYVPVFEAGLEKKIARDLESYEQRIKILAESRALNDAFRSAPDSHFKDSKRSHLVYERSVLQMPIELLESFVHMGADLLGCGKLCSLSSCVKYAKTGRIETGKLSELIGVLEAATETRKIEDEAATADVRDDKLPVIRQAVNSDVVWDEIVEIEILPDPGEMVYDLTVPGNDSFMVDCGVLVHNTLNSVVHGTELMLRQRDPNTSSLAKPPFGRRRIVCQAIGDLVDKCIECASEAHTERHPNDTTLVWLKDGGDEGPIHSGLEVLSTDEDGRVMWKEVTAVTRHPVVNKDGSDTLIEVTTESGRSVTATKGKSFLTRRNNKLVATEGEDLKVGDHLPITRTLKIADADVMEYLEVDTYLPRTEFLYQFRTGCVYPKQQGARSRGHFPERIKLDELFGFYAGAYLADGSEGNMQVHISNIDKDYQQRIIEFAERYEFGWHLQDRTDQRGICIHSKVIAELTVRMFGRGAPNKRIPPELIAANTEFLKGLIDGYFSGDGSCWGCWGTTTYIVNASSASRGLIEDVANVLLRFDIGSRFRVLTHTEKGNPILPSHQIYVRNGDALRFAETFTFTKKAKQDKLIDMTDVVMQNPSYQTPEDIIPAIELPGSGTTIESIHRDELPALLTALSNVEDRKVIEMALGEDVWYDKIVSIKDVPNPKGPYVFDLTVRDTRTFVIWNGMSCEDTFHSAGIGGAASNITRGVPRMKELMSMSKNIKTPSMKIMLRREWATSQERTQAVLSTLETTHFRDVVKRSSVHFDPSDANTRIKEDEGLMAFYRDFAGDASDAANPNASCPWVLRFEFDRMKMLNLQVTMLDLEYALVDHFDDAVAAVLSDDNADHLVCRLRLNALSDIDEMTDLLTEMKAMEHAVMDQLVIKGLKGISKAVLHKPSSGLKKYDPVTDAYVMDDEWFIETAGTNLMDVLCHPCVDYTRTMTNDVYEAYLVLGIEAARQAVIDEMRGVLDSTPIDHRHLSLLADTMSNRGFFMSIDRHGINNRGELGPLAKCSFEQSTDMLIKAGMFSERDRINGVSANIMLGQVAPCGTGDCQVLMDNERLASLGKPVSLEAPKRMVANSPLQENQVEASSSQSPIAPLPEFDSELTIEDDEEEEKKKGPPGRRKKIDALKIV